MDWTFGHVNDCVDDMRLAEYGILGTAWIEPGGPDPSYIEKNIRDRYPIHSSCHEKCKVCKVCKTTVPEETQSECPFCHSVGSLVKIG